MENRSHALLTGFFTITLLIAAVLFGLWFNRDRVERVPYELATSQAIPGLNPQAAVRYRGLDVGKVRDIDFDPKVTGQILVSLSIDPDAPITSTTFATLGYQGVTGIAFIQLDDEATGSPRLPTSARKPARIPLRPGLFDQLEKRSKLILSQAEEATRRLNNLLSPANQQTIMASFSNLSQTAIAYRSLPEQLEPALARLPALADQAHSTLASVGTLANEVKSLSRSLQAPDGPLLRMSGTVERLGQSLESLSGGVEHEALPQLMTLTEETRASMRALKTTANTLNERPQSLLFGAPASLPGPGEAGFAAPTK